MVRKQNFDLHEALDAVDFLADRGAFNRRIRRTGQWVISKATVTRVKHKIEAEWWARKAARKASRKGVGGSRAVGSTVVAPPGTPLPASAAGGRPG